MPVGQRQRRDFTCQGIFSNFGCICLHSGWGLIWSKQPSTPNFQNVGKICNFVGTNCWVRFCLPRKLHFSETRFCTNVFSELASFLTGQMLARKCRFGAGHLSFRATWRCLYTGEFFFFVPFIFLTVSRYWPRTSCKAASVCTQKETQKAHWFSRSPSRTQKSQQESDNIC